MEEINEKPSEEFVNDRLSTLEAELVEQREYTEHLHNTIHTICTSYAWKITEPLRIFEGWIIRNTPQVIKRTIKKLFNGVDRSSSKSNDLKDPEQEPEIQTERQEVSSEWIPRVIKYDDWEEREYEYTKHEPLDTSVRVIAHYLPQFHPFEENDKWWGKGFTEWRNVTKAKPLFEGHHQPRLPSELGFYDLRLIETMREQAQMAKNYGISGFAYYFYWFSGKTIMELPLKQMLNDSSVDMPFCLSWANENWTRKWDGLEHEVLIRQNYTKEDSKAFIEHVLKYMEDKRYIKVDNCPVLIVYRAEEIPHIKEMTDLWRECARKHGHPGLYLIAVNRERKSPELQKIGFDAAEDFPPLSITPRNVSSFVTDLHEDFSGGIYDYREAVSEIVKCEEPEEKTHPCVMLRWDNTSRTGINGHAFTNFKLKYYKQWLSHACHKAFSNKELKSDERLVFINAWNEWAEGTYLEPDSDYKYGYLESTRAVCEDFKTKDYKYSKFSNLSKLNDQALVIHLHYVDVWPEIARSIDELSLKYDIYVTATSQQGVLAARTRFPEANIELVENRGRDILPFIRTLNHIKDFGYKFCCKIHTKKSVYRSDGDLIRTSLVTNLLQNEKEIVDKFNADERVGLVASSSSLLRHNFDNMFANNLNVQKLSCKLNIQFEESSFPAGSMYWFRPEAIKSLSGLSAAEFDIERGLTDGVTAHAVERIMTSVVTSAGFTVKDQA